MRRRSEEANQTSPRTGHPTCDIFSGVSCVHFLQLCIVCVCVSCVCVCVQRMAFPNKPVRKNSEKVWSERTTALAFAFLSFLFKIFNSGVLD